MSNAGLGRRHAGVVDQDRERPQLGLGLGDAGPPIRLSRTSSRHRQGPAVEAGDLLGQIRQGRHPPGGHGDLDPGPGQGQGEMPTQPAGGAGHQSDLVLEAAEVSSSDMV